MKRMNNSGLSLVELIVVIAIMALLTAVLAPQFLRYVEKSRIQKDESLMSEIEKAVSVSCSYYEVYDALPSGDVYATVTIQNGAMVTADVPELEAELRRAVPDTIHFASKKYIDLGSQTVNVSIDAPRRIVIITHSWSDTL